MSAAGEMRPVMLSTMAVRAKLTITSPTAKAADYQPPPPFLTRSQETYTDWIQSCKSGNPSASNFDVAGPFTEWITMGCIACRVSGKLEWDPVKLRITNNKEANKFVKPTFRKGWSFT